MPSGEHTITVRATSSISGQVVTTTTGVLNVGVIVIAILDITGKQEVYICNKLLDYNNFNDYLATQDISGQTYTFNFAPNESFPVQCSIDGQEPVDCEYIKWLHVAIDYCHCIGEAPYVINTTTLSRGQHNITFSITINGEVRGLATQTFIVNEGTIYI